MLVPVVYVVDRCPFDMYLSVVTQHFKLIDRYVK